MAATTFPKSQKIMKIGWVGTGPFSFYGDYMRVINAPDYNPMNMRVTHLWGDDYAKNYAGSEEYVTKMLDYWNGKQSPESLCERYSIPNLCNDFHEMIDDVDAAMIMDFDRMPELAEPFILKGKPVFLCSPVALNVPTLNKALDLAEKHGSAVYTGSFTIGMPENRILAGRINKKNIKSYYAFTYHNYFTSYANDGLEPVHSMIGMGVKKVALYGWAGSKGYDPTGIPVSRIHLEYEPREDNPPIQGVLTLGGRGDGMEWYRIYNRNNSVMEGRTHWSGDYRMNFRDFLLDIQQVFATNESLQTREEIVETLSVVIAAFKSANEGGRTIAVDEIGDYCMPTVRIEKWDEIPE